MSRDRLSDAIEHLEESVVLWDAEDRIVFANRRFRENNAAIAARCVPGTRFEDFIRATARSGMYPQAAGNEEAWVAERLAWHRNPGTGPLEFERADGRWLRIANQRLPGGGIITFSRDITDTKRTVAQLQESQRRFQDFARASSDWYWETDDAGRFTWHSGPIEEQFGMAPGTLQGRRGAEFVRDGLPAGSPEWARFRDALRGRQPFRAVRHAVRVGEAECWLEISGVPRFDAAGAFLGYRGAGCDVTASVAMERRARAAEERLRAGLENLGEMVVLTDADDRIVVANRRFVEFNAAVAAHVRPGCAYVDHLQAGIALGMFPEAAGREAAWLAERMAQRRNPTGPVERRRQDGRWLMVDDQRLPDGGTISFGIEITERKRAEEALRDMNAELERRVAERTALLEKTNRELEAFSYSVSHDLRAPLRAVSGFAGILLEEESARLSPEGRRRLASIDANARRMGMLIDGLLSLGRLSRHELARQRIDMNALAREAWDELALQYPGATLALGELPPALGDATLVRQVLHNLVGNALKYSARTATPRIEIGSTGAAGTVEYFVADNGAGFDMAYAGKLFKAFERLHGEDEFEGTGIGLAITQMIVQRHGGRIRAEGAPGQGATFRFTLG